MIGILQNKNLTDKKMSEIIEWHWENVKKLLADFRKIPEQKKLLNQLKKKLKPSTIEEVVKAKFDELVKLKESLSHDKLNKFICNGGSKKEQLIVYLYNKYRSQYGAELVKRLEISVCPYCNRNFINSEGDRTPAQFDHFFNKSEYPIFALSLYNLIPCCGTCNNWKSTTDFIISPYDKTFTTDALLRFSYIPTSSTDYDIKVLSNNSKMDINISKLRLEKRYSTHKDLLKELIAKYTYYPVCHQRFLTDLIQKNGIPNGMNLDEFFYGNYMTEDKYYLRPLSKFTHDIVEELTNSSKNRLI